MAKVLIDLGHSAYSGANAGRLCFSKAQAIRVLCNRGLKRDEARTALRREFDPRTRRGSISLDNFNSVECRVYVDSLPYGWEGLTDYQRLKASWKNSPEF